MLRVEPVSGGREADVKGTENEGGVEKGMVKKGGWWQLFGGRNSPDDCTKLHLDLAVGYQFLRTPDPDDAGGLQCQAPLVHTRHRAVQPFTDLSLSHVARPICPAQSYYAPFHKYCA